MSVEYAESFLPDQAIPNEDETAAIIRRDFVDCAAAGAETLNELLAAYLPFNVEYKVSQVKWTLQLTGLLVEITNDDGIRATASSTVMPRRRLDPLREALRGIVSQALNEGGWSTVAFGVLLLQLAEEASWHVQDFQRSTKRVFGSSLNGEMGMGWDATSVSDWSKILNNPHGVDLLTVNDTAKFLLGQPVEEILADFPGFLRVLHVEPVFRSDLVSRFLQRRKEMKERLMEMNYNQLRECVTRSQMRSGEVLDGMEGLAEHLCTPHVTFHGAPRSVISSIVRYGFLKPGDKIGKTNSRVETTCGASFGVGVYSSPSLEYASLYGQYNAGMSGFRNPGDIPGLRMVVCATLMGRPLRVTRNETRGTEGLFNPSADSHVSPNQMEYIVFDTAQIIPCYVLHLDYGAEAAKSAFDSLRSSDPASLQRGALALKSRLDSASSFSHEDREFPAARQAKKAALKAAAAKWFPYGYGPATGTSFVIEEIGEVDDDEEEVGEFQAMRGEVESAAWMPERAADEKGSWFDEYQTVRLSKAEVKVNR